MQKLESFAESELIALSHSLERAERYEELEAALQRLRAQSPALSEHTRRLGWVLLKLNRPAEAEEVFAQIKGTSPSERAEIAGGAGVAALRNGHGETAIRLLSKAVDNGFAPAREPLVHALNAAGQFREGLGVTSKMAREAPLDTPTAMLHANQLAYAGKCAEAASSLVRLFSSKSPNREGLEFLAQLLTAAGDYAGASHILGQMLRRAIENDQMHVLWTHCLTAGYSDENARAHLEDLVARDPEHAAAFFQLGLMHERLGNLDRAMAFVESAAALEPDSLLIVGLRARLELLQGKPAAASEHQKKVWSGNAERLASQLPVKYDPYRRDPAEGGTLNAILYLPVEISSRDLMSRLFLACYAARAGFVVVLLGHTVLRHASQLPAGIIVNKSLNAMDGSLATQAKANGHLFTVIDEESFGWTGGAYSQMRTLNPGLLPFCDAIFAPGAHYAESIAGELPEARAKLIVTGNPRTDFYEPRFARLFSSETQALRETYGANFLICTNFGCWNSGVHPYSTVCATVLKASNPDFESPRGRWILDIFSDAAEAECRNFSALRTVIPALAADFPERKIIIRPHPAEGVAVWNRLAETAPNNVVVVNSSSLQAQMRASDAVIHLAGCGTGVEAVLAGRPSICFNPVDDLPYPKLGISTLLSPSAANVETLSEYLAGIAASPHPIAPTTRQNDVLGTHIHRSGKLVSEEIASHLTALFEAAAHTPLAAPKPGREQLMKVLRGNLQAAKTKADAHSFGNVALKAKRLSVTKREILEQLAILRSCIDMPGQFAVDEPAEGVFIIRKE